MRREATSTTSSVIVRPLTRVNATSWPFGDQTGHQSCDARIGRRAADAAGTATASKRPIPRRRFTRPACQALVSGPSAHCYLCLRERLRLHDVPCRQVLRPRPAGAGEHLALVPARREDRRARSERRRQVDAAPDHGAEGGAVLGRRRACPERDRRPPRAGAGPRPGQDGARERRGRRARVARPHGPVQRNLGEVRRARRRLRRAPRRAGDGAGRDRPRGCMAARAASRPRDGRAARARRRPRRDHAVRRRASPRGVVPAASLGARPPAPRRADEPSRRRIGRLAGALPRRVQGNRRRRHARSLLPRQRRRLDPRARPRPRYPLPGELLVVARTEAGAPRDRGEDGVGAASHARPRARMGADEPARATRQVEGAPRRVRAPVRGGAERQARQGRDPHPAGPAPRRRRHRGRGRAEGIRRPAARRGPDVLASAGRASSASSARTAPARRRSSG